MLKRWLIMIGIIGLVSCHNEKDMAYYKTHPKVLRDEVRMCAGNITEHCRNLYAIAEKLDMLMIELQRSPEAFGQRIMSIQMDLTHAKEMRANALINQYKEHLAMRLAVVRWLESPESVT